MKVQKIDNHDSDNRLGRSEKCQNVERFSPSNFGQGGTKALIYQKICIFLPAREILKHTIIHLILLCCIAKDEK